MLALESRGPGSSLLTPGRHACGPQEAGTAPERHTAHVARLASEASDKEASEKLAAQVAAAKREAEIEQAES